MYQKKEKFRKAFHIPIAWKKLIEEHDDFLVDILADKVESICGYKPNPDQIASFFDQLFKDDRQIEIPVSQKPPEISRIPTKVRRPIISETNACGLVFRGKQFRYRNAIDIMINAFEMFSKNDGMFLERFASLPKHGRTRRYLAKTKEELYPGRSDLAQEFSIKLSSGWWLGTNYSRADIKKIIKMACDVAGINLGSEIQIELGKE